jgi:hypothetical protein
MRCGQIGKSMVFTVFVSFHVLNMKCTAQCSTHAKFNGLG